MAPIIPHPILSSHQNQGAQQAHYEQQQHEEQPEQQQESTATTFNTSSSSSPSKKRIVKIGTRKSQLAMIQAEAIRDDLQRHHPDVEFVIVSKHTAGDNNKVTPLHEFGAKSLWTLDLENLLLADQVDLIVHCLKDMPTLLPPGCIIGSITEREDPRDALVMKKGSPYKSFEELPAGSVVGTSSVRRGAQIARAFPQLAFQDVRGNVDTRLAKLDDPEGPYACLILACAGLIRMNLADRITARPSHPILLHAVGQGALGIEIREHDSYIQSLIDPLTHRPSLLSCLAERSLMRKLEGGCSVPIGVETEFSDHDGEEGKGRLVMRASVSSVDGVEQVAADDEVDGVVDVRSAEDVGLRMAKKLLDGGAGKILSHIVRAKETSAAAAEVARLEQVQKDEMQDMVEHLHPHHGPAVEAEGEEGHGNMGGAAVA